MKTGSRIALLLALLLGSGAADAGGQDRRTLFPDRSLIPVLLAGPRDPATSVSPMYVGPNPHRYGSGLEVEVSIGSTLPLVLLAGRDQGHPLALGIEAAAFGRFGLQVRERELIASDWVFAIPMVWHRNDGWIRVRYYHTSSHMGDEYARRFEDPGINFSRDAAEVLSFHTFSPHLGVYGGVRYAYNVHPEEAERWVLRAGAEIQPRERRGFRPFLAGDVEWDEAAGGTRIELRAGTWLPRIAGRRSLTVALVLLAGPSPLGQFTGMATTQAGLSLRGFL